MPYSVSNHEAKIINVIFLFAIILLKPEEVLLVFREMKIATHQCELLEVMLFNEAKYKGDESRHV